ncbi:MAG: HAD family hydrolase [Bacteroidetes bacterium]|nr:HAD family hydrolase [Bacteroidota bacterium]
MNSHTLLLFDIDGTLVLYRDDFPHRMFEEMTSMFFDRPVSLADYRFSGKTDKLIISEVSALAGVTATELESREADIVEWIPKRLEEHIDESTFELLPNVRSILDQLAARPNTTLALLTGNLPRCAELKLGQFGLMKYFEFGAYGIESRDRNDLGPIALRKFQESKGFEPSDVVIVGDALPDIHVAKHIDARVLVTLTGRTTRDEVLPHEPDHIFDDLTNTEAVLQAIYG